MMNLAGVQLLSILKGTEDSIVLDQEKDYFPDDELLRSLYETIFPSKTNRPPDWYKNHFKSRKYIKASCGACGFKSKLHAHHIDGDYTNNVKENIQTLCTFCHNYLHLVQKRMCFACPGRFPEFEKKEKELLSVQKS